MPARNDIGGILLAASTSLGLTLLIERFYPDDTTYPDAIAGWIAAMAVMLIARLAKSMTRKNLQPLWPLALVIIRLFVLIILFLVVSITGFFEAGSFATGLLGGYFLMSWTEVFYRPASRLQTSDGTA